MNEPSKSSPVFTSDLTRQLADEAELLTRLAPEAHAIPLEEEDQAIAQLLQQYEKLDLDVRSELATLANLMPDEEGRALRAVICRPGHAEIAITKDFMEAVLEVHPPEGGGKPATTPEVVELLRARGIIFGVDLTAVRAAVDECARTQKPSRGIVIARGRPPLTGTPGRLETCISEPLASTGRERHLQQWMVKRGDLLAREIPPTAGIPGTNVVGQSLPATPGAITRPQLLSGVDYSPQIGEYKAALDGLAQYDGSSLEIRRQIVWDGDLTLHDKPIDFNGAVLIRGSLRDGAHVQATEDIEITGGVEGATVISTGGAVNIRQGVVGRGRGFISAKTNVDARYFENATAYAQEDIISRHAVVHSRLTAGRVVRAELDKGTMFGGEIRAGMGVYTKSLGNAAGIATIVAVGFDWETLSKLHEVEGELADLRQRTARCEEIIAGFRRAKSNLAQLSPTERNAVCAVLKRHLTLKAKIHQALERIRVLETAAIRSGKGDIVCRENLYPGTVIKIGPAIAQIAGTMSACTITYNRESRKLVSVQPSGRTVPLATNN